MEQRDIDNAARHIRMDLWARNGSGSLIAVDKWYQADTCAITVAYDAGGGRIWDKTIDVKKANFPDPQGREGFVDTDAFERHCRAIHGTLVAMYLHGRRDKAKQIKASLEGAN